MKKTLVFAMAMALGVSATAFAANPFSDLPAGHWAYASVAKLAAAGIVDGYPDGTFKGDRTMTRYEMAQIVAKALAKGAIGADDKLVGEFADELDNLGVRVAKLEKNADNVKITGNIRTDYANYSGDIEGYRSKIRSRLFLTGEVNDNWHYVGMLQNEQNLTNNDGDTVTRFQRAYLDGNIGAVKVTAGRFNDTITNGNVYDNRVDGVRIVAGKDVKFTAAYGKMANTDNIADAADAFGSEAGKYWRIGVDGKLGKNLSLGVDYINSDDVSKSTGITGMTYAGRFDKQKIWDVKAAYTAANWNLGVDYIHGDSDVADVLGGGTNGYVVSLGYGAAKASKPGSLGVWAKYYNQPGSTLVDNTFNANYGSAFGFKGYGIGVDYTVAKNMVAGVQWFDLKDKAGVTEDMKRQTLWSQLIVTF